MNDKFSIPIHFFTKFLRLSLTELQITESITGNKMDFPLLTLLVICNNLAGFIEIRELRKSYTPIVYTRALYILLLNTTPYSIRKQ